MKYKKTILKKQIFIGPHTAQFTKLLNKNSGYQFCLRNDHYRELAYRKAIEDLSKRHLNIKNILDAGTGTGVWAVAMASCFPSSKTFAIDIHKENIKLGKENLRFFPFLKNRLFFKHANIRKYKPKENFDIICTELEGGVGNNEGAKRYFKDLQKILAPKGIIIPKKIKIYIVPVSIENLNLKLPNTNQNPFLKNKKIILKDPYSCYYQIFGIDNSCFIGKPKLLDLIKTTSKINEGFEKELNFIIRKNSKLTGFLVWFSHELTDNIYLSNNPDYGLTSWGQAYFPVKPLPIKKGINIKVKFKEIMKNKNPVPYYTWQVSFKNFKSKEYSNYPIWNLYIKN